VDTVQLSGSNSGFAFVTQAVSGGTDVISLPIPATVADYLDVVSLYDQIPGGFAISDTAAHISAGLNSLNDAKINTITISDNGQIGVLVAQLTSDATAISKLANQNGMPYQLAVTDTAADITSGLNGLDGSHIASITISDNGQIGVSVAQLTSDATAISKLADASGGAYQLAVTDTAADISAGLNGLNGANIVSITISDNHPVGVDVAQLTSDATAIGKLANAGGGAYQLAISDTAANVQGDLANLEADAAHIASIALTSGTIVVFVSTFTADQGALDKISGGFTVSDSAANISASLNALNDANIDTISISDNNPVGLDVAQLTSDSTAISKFVNANGMPYQLAVSDTAAHVVAGLSTLNADSHVASITVTSGSATLSGSVGANAPILSETGSGTSLTIGEALTYAGAFTQGAGSTTTITAGNSLTLTGTAMLGGTTSGAGTLDLASGSATIDSGAKVSVSNWSISGSGADVTLGEALTYSGSFSEGAGDTFVLSGGNLLLKGAAAFAGGTVDGAKLLETEGTTTISGLTIGGTVEWENTKTVTQTGGTVTIGDSSGDKAFLDNTATGAYDITGASAIGRGSSTASYIKNAGLIEQTGGTGISTIAPAVTNTGTLEVASGTLDFMGAVTGKGIDTISGASTLEFDAAVASKTTVGDQDIGFTGGGGGTLDLTDPKAFWGEISNFGATDTIELLGSWTYSSFSENSGGTLATLTLASGATKHAFDFVGSYAQGDFKITSGATSTITFT
jgi:hypothetical protein